MNNKPFTNPYATRTHERHSRFPIVVGIILAGLILLGILIWRQFFSLYVFSTTPTTTNSIASITPVVTLNLNMPISDKNLSITAPKGITATYTVHGKSVDMNIFTSFDINKKYTFRINHLESSNGHILKDKDITFTSNDSNNVTSAEEKLLEDRQVANRPSILSDPVYNALPYTGTNFTITPYADPSSDGKGRVAIEVVIFAPDSETDNPNSPIVLAARQSVLSQLQAINGWDPVKYVVTYKVQGSGG